MPAARRDDGPATPVYHFYSMSPSTGSATGLIDVIDASGEHREWIDEETARGYICKGWATMVWRRRGKIRTIQLLPDAPSHRLLELNGRGSGAYGTTYFYDFETETNPPRVYALKYHSPRMRAAFTQVLADCGAVV